MIPAIALGLGLLLQAKEEKPPEFATTKEAMQRVQLIVGEWRCTGQPREMEREAWTEKHAWNFRIEKDLYRIALAAEGGVFWKEAVLGYDVKGKAFTLEAQLAGGGTRSYRGQLREKDRELVLEEVREDWPRERAVFGLLRANRFLLSLETQAAARRDWAVQAILGCTKEGVPFVRGEARVCLVTGGAGTMAVTHKGKTYYVCWTGCRDYFLEDPEKAIEAAKKEGRLKE